MAAPTVLFHTYDQAEAALAMAERQDEPVVLTTTPDAAAFAGPAYLATAFERARRAHPAAKALAWIDCGEDAGLVLRAIKAGWRHILFTGPKLVSKRIADIGAQEKADIRSHRMFQRDRTTGLTARMARTKDTAITKARTRS